MKNRRRHRNHNFEFLSGHELFSASFGWCSLMARALINNWCKLCSWSTYIPTVSDGLILHRRSRPLILMRAYKISSVFKSVSVLHGVSGTPRVLFSTLRSAVLGKVFRGPLHCTQSKFIVGNCPPLTLLNRGSWNRVFTYEWDTSLSGALATYSVNNSFSLMYNDASESIMSRSPLSLLNNLSFC